MSTDIIISFMAGIILTLLSMVGYIFALAKSYKPEETKTLRNRLSKKDSDKLVASIKVRFKEIEGLTVEQLRLVDILKAPNKGAMHAKGKGGVLRRVEELEDAKINIFRSIVKDGFNPSVGIYDNDGQKVEMKMSEAIAKRDASHPPVPPTPTPFKPKLIKTDLNNTRENVYKLSDFRSKNESGPTKTN